MADIITHAFFAVDAADKYQMKRIDLIKLFSYGPHPFNYIKNNRRYSLLMHQEKSLLFFKNMVLEIKERHLTNDKAVKACLYGFISHYVLDTTLHPFIIYKTGIKSNRREQVKCLDKHRELELYLSRYIIENRIGKFKTWRGYYSLFENLDISPTIVEVLDAVFFKTFGFEDGGKKYVQGLKNMKFYFKHFRYDPKGFKYQIYRILNPFYNKRDLKNISFYKVNEQDLNLAHKEWKHPCNRDELTNDSAIDLYIHALFKMGQMIKVVDDIFLKQQDVEKMNEVFEDLSYFTGKDWQTNLPFKYFEE